MSINETIDAIAIIGAFGVVLLILSNAMYYQRTKDKSYWKKFWLSKGILSNNEYVINRLGFTLAFCVMLFFILFSLYMAIS